MATAKKVTKTAAKASKKPAAKAPAAPAKAAAKVAAKKAPVAAKKAAPVAAKATPTAKAHAAPKAAAAKAVPEKKGAKATPKNVAKPAAKAPSVPFDVTARRPISDAPVKKGRAAAQEKAARYTSNFDDDVNAEPPLEEEELSLDADEDELGEEEEGDVEGPPPWWKADPTGIETKDDEAETGANFDDSDEWTEDDEEWDSTPNAATPAPKDRTVEEDSEDEDERW